MFIKLRNSQGFTLVELLIVIAIIGVLSGIVLTSLNSAREKGKIVAIKSTLKQLYNQASLNQLENGSFTGSNISYSDLTCSGNLLKIAQPLIDQGIVVRCFSFYGTSSGGVYVGDDYQRFGATAIIYDTTELKAWSVDENGVVKWDTIDLASATWENAKIACANNGGRLSSFEELRTLSHAWYSASSNNSYTPTGFVADSYWSSTTIPSSPGSLSYRINLTNGNSNYSSQTIVHYVRCVR